MVLYASFRVLLLISYKIEIIAKSKYFSPQSTIMDNSGGLHNSNHLDSNQAAAASTAALTGIQQQQPQGMVPAHSLSSLNASSSTSSSLGLLPSHPVVLTSETPQEQEPSSNQQIGTVGTSQACSSSHNMLGSQPKAQWLPQHVHSFKSMSHLQGQSQSLRATVQSINNINSSFDKNQRINNDSNLASNALLNAGFLHPGSTSATVGNHSEPTPPPPPASAPAIAPGGRFSTNQQLPLLQPRPIQPATSAISTTSSGSSANPVVNPQHYPFQALSMTNQPQPLQEDQKRKDLNLFFPWSVHGSDVISFLCDLIVVAYFFRFFWSEKGEPLQQKISKFFSFENPNKRLIIIK